MPTHTQKKLFGGLVAGVIAAGSCLVAVPASAAEVARHAGSSSVAPGRASLHDMKQVQRQYSDVQILELLLAGQGRAATDHPQLVRLLGFSLDKPHTDTAALHQIIREYLTFNPRFGDLRRQITSGDPAQVNAGLRDFSRSFSDFLTHQYRVDPTGSAAQLAAARGWAWMGAYVLVYVNAVAVANAGVYANVGVATFALATLALVTWYLPEEGTASDSALAYDALVARMSTSLG